MSESEEKFIYCCGVVARYKIYRIKMMENMFDEKMFPDFHIIEVL